MEHLLRLGPGPASAELVQLLGTKHGQCSAEAKVLMFVLLRIIQMPFATADEHVWELYASAPQHRGCTTLFALDVACEHGIWN